MFRPVCMKIHTKNNEAPFACSVRSSHPLFTSRQMCLTLENAMLVSEQ